MLISGSRKIVGGGCWEFTGPGGIRCISKEGGSIWTVP